MTSIKIVNLFKILNYIIRKQIMQTWKLNAFALRNLLVGMSGVCIS